MGTRKTDSPKYEVPKPLYKLLRDGDRAQNIMGALLATKVKGKSTYARDDGLVEGHSYAITQVVRIEDDNKDFIRMIQLRSPWGPTQIWKGAWSHGDKKWETNPSIAKQLEYDDERDFDGLFWMEFEEFTSLFSEIVSVPLPDTDFIRNGKMVGIRRAKSVETYVEPVEKKKWYEKIGF